MIMPTEMSKEEQLQYKANEFFNHYINDIKSDIILAYRYGGEKISLRFGYTNQTDWEAMSIFLERLEKFFKDKFDLTSTIRNENNKLYVVELELLTDRKNMNERLEKVNKDAKKEK